MQALAYWDAATGRPVDVTTSTPLPMVEVPSAAAGPQPVTKETAVTTDGAYAAGDVVGGLIELTAVNWSTGRPTELRNLQIGDKNGNALALRFYFFKSAPAGTYTNNAALSWHTGDSALKVGQVDVQAGDWITDNSQSSVNVGLEEIMNVAVTSLWMLIVCPTGSAPTYTNGGLTVKSQWRPL